MKLTGKGGESNQTTYAYREAGEDGLYRSSVTRTLSLIHISCSISFYCFYYSIICRSPQVIADFLQLKCLPKQVAFCYIYLMPLKCYSHSGGKEMNHIIEVDHLMKSYGTVKAVQDISFYVEEGGLFAFLGPNGAGKSTTINMICTFSVSYTHLLFGNAWIHPKILTLP